MKKFRKLVLVILVFWLAQLACSGQVDPSDPAIQPAIIVEVGDFADFLSQLGLLNQGIIPPPRIIVPQAHPDQAGQIEFAGLGYTKEDLRSSAAPVVKLYTLQFRGCDQAPEPLQLLGEFTIGADRNWSTTVSVEPGAVVGAMISTDGKESGWSNLIVVEPTALKLKVSEIILYDNQRKLFSFPPDNPIPVQLLIRPNEGEQVNLFPTAHMVIKGTGPSGYCLTLVQKHASRREDLGDTYTYVYGVGETSIGDDGKWQSPNIAIDIGFNETDFVSWPPVDFDSQITEITTQQISWPLGKDNNGYIGKITAWYGPNDHHNTQGGRCSRLSCFHNGIDIFAPQGTTVYPAADGKVLYVRQNPNAVGGKYIVIDHGAWATSYLHLGTINVKPGDRVYAGKTKIGTVGNTGGVGVHLHFNAFIWGRGYPQNLPGYKDNILLNAKGQIMINLNPTASQDLFKGHSGKELRSCASSYSFLDVDWEKIEVLWDTYTGTAFSELGNGPCRISP